MNASLTTFLACGAAVALLSIGCDKKSDAAGPAGSASATSAGTAAATGTTATTTKKPKATLKAADVKAAYKAEVDNTAKMKDPMDKKVEGFVGKVGKPESDTGRKKTWYALDGDKCTKFELDTKDGSLTDSTTDKADCGM